MTPNIPDDSEKRDGTPGTPIETGFDTAESDPPVVNPDGGDRNIG